ncbi:hypothetical protein ACSV5M_18140 [Cellvibrio sp. ARAG 10.3]|uniref:hypothetical protein n=1 Tax=Cellvibrio sp. ARAG 10.3 TaxID=3451358 RepID=UPI003F448165
MRPFVRLMMFSALFCVAPGASASSLDFHGCIVDVPQKFSSNSKGNYYYLNNVFKNISIDEGEDINTFYPNPLEIKHMDSFEGADGYYLFNYILYDLNNPQSSINHIRVWKNNKSLNFVGFGLGEVKDMVKHCSDRWVHISEEDFLKNVL